MTDLRPMQPIVAQIQTRVGGAGEGDSLILLKNKFVPARHPQT